MQIALSYKEPKKVKIDLVPVVLYSYLCIFITGMIYCFLFGTFYMLALWIAMMIWIVVVSYFIYDAKKAHSNHHQLDHTLLSSQLEPS